MVEYPNEAAELDAAREERDELLARVQELGACIRDALVVIENWPGKVYGVALIAKVERELRRT